MRVGGLLLPLACFGYGCLYLYLPILYIYLGMYRVDSSTICTWIVDLVWPYYTLNCNAWCDASASNLWMRVCMWMCVFSKCKYVWELVFCLYIYTSNVWMRVLLNLLFIFFHYFFGREMWILIDEMKCRYFFSVVIKRLLLADESVISY